MAKEYTVAVLGATGVVGREMMKVLEQRKFPVKRLLPLASERTAGTTVKFRGDELRVVEATEKTFTGVDIGLFSAGGPVSERFAPMAARGGTVVIDNTSVFRMKPEVPLVVPEVNRHALKRHKGIISNPNCSTAQMVVVLKPIHDAAKIKRVVVATYQSVSGAGKEAMDELREQTRAYYENKTTLPKFFKRPIAFNLFPHIDVFLENGYTKEEMKMVNETQKIMEDESIRVTATTVRVPVFIGHSEAVNIVTEKKLTAREVREILSRAPGIKVMDDPAKAVYPTPLDAEGKDETLVGRIREDISDPHGIDLWIVADNLRKGAATNAVQIAECLIEDNLL